MNEFVWYEITVHMLKKNQVFFAHI